MVQQSSPATHGQRLAAIIADHGLYPATRDGDLLTDVDTRDPGTNLGIVKFVGEYPRLIGRIAVAAKSGVICHYFAREYAIVAKMIADAAGNELCLVPDVSQTRKEAILLDANDPGDPDANAIFANSMDPYEATGFAD